MSFWKNFFKKKIIKNTNFDITPDDIFSQSKNLPGFDTSSLEGQIEKPIPLSVLKYISLFFLFIIIIYSSKLFYLQVIQGSSFLLKSQNNILDNLTVFSSRGVVYDRNGVELVWNSESKDDTNFARREYINAKGFAHTLGYVSYPKEDKYGNFYQDNFEGKDGVEKYYNDLLSGENGLRIVEVDALGNTISENLTKEVVQGQNLNLTIDSKIQKKIYEYIENLSKEKGFNGGAGVIVDITNGEVIAMTSFPEYDSKIMTEGVDTKSISKFILDSRNPFLNRVAGGLYTPGSIVKPFISLAALNEKIINPSKKILSTGSISLENPYFPGTYSVFNDWKAHGWTDMRKALAVSSDVYFYVVGGGFKDQMGLGIEKIVNYMEIFGFGEKTDIDFYDDNKGIIPSPSWKKSVFGEPWRIGDTYITSIGQYGFQVTPIQVVKAVSSIANGGKLVTPKILKNEETKYTILPFRKEDIKVVQEGMRMAVTDGTAKGLNVPYVKIAAKTGTAELGISKKFVNSWVMGYFPYEKPKYAFVFLMERGPEENTIGGLYVARQTFDWMNVNLPEYFQI